MSDTAVSPVELLTPEPGFHKRTNGDIEAAKRLKTHPMFGDEKGGAK